LIKMLVDFGLKLWSTNIDLIVQAKELIEDNVFQYIELTPVPGTELTPFLGMEIPYVVHVTTERYGLNIADRKKRGYNLKTINDCIAWADELDAMYLILHPGFGLMDDSMDFLGSVDEKRILIENMPKVGLGGESMVGCEPEQIKQLMDDRFGFCLDFGHAVKAAVSLEVDYRELINGFMGLKPSVFHLSDGCSNTEIDDHKSFGEGDFDLDYMIRVLKKEDRPKVTMETPHSSGLIGDVDNVNYLRVLIDDQH
jgi:endonuclease IV